MNDRHLVYFVAVAEELSFTRAALRCHIEQAPMSKAIRNLEEELGFKLFSRSTRSVELTAAGRVYLESARAALAQLDKGASLAKLVDHGIAGTLTLAHVGSTGYVILPTLIREFRKSHPMIDFKIRQLTSYDQLPAIEAGTVDVGLCRAQPATEQFHSECIYSEDFLCAVPHGHALAKRETVQLGELARQPFIMMVRRPAPSLFDQVTTICTEAGFIPRVAQEMGQLESIVGLVSSGIGIALVPASMRRLSIPEVRYISIVDCSQKAKVWMVWAQDAESRLAKAFIDSARAHVPLLQASAWEPGAAGRALPS